MKEKKKEKYYRTDLLWIPCLILFLIFLGYICFFLETPKKFTFTIYKKVCHNESTKIDWRADIYYGDLQNLMYFIKDYSEFGCNYYEKYNLLNESKICFSMNLEKKEKEERVNKLYKEILEEVEVCEKIEFGDQDWVRDICMNNEPCGDYQVSRFKKDLTKEWLDENCLIYYGKEYITKEQGDFEMGNQITINKYKCGDYFVEIIE